MSAETGQWVRDGMMFFLLDRSKGDLLDTVTVSLTESGCPLLEFKDGYVRNSGTGFVAFERIQDKNRMSVLPAQPLDLEATHFPIPHFAVFSGSDTFLKLIHLSPIPSSRRKRTRKKAKKRKKKPNRFP